MAVSAAENRMRGAQRKYLTPPTSVKRHKPKHTTGDGAMHRARKLVLRNVALALVKKQLTNKDGARRKTDTTKNCVTVLDNKDTADSGAWCKTHTGHDDAMHNARNSYHQEW